MARISKDEWNGHDEPSVPGWGSADITFEYRTLDMCKDGVNFVSNSQTISGERLLSAAAFLIESYCRAEGIPVEEVTISVKRPKS